MFLRSQLFNYTIACNPAAKGLTDHDLTFCIYNTSDGLVQESATYTITHVVLKKQ